MATNLITAQVSGGDDALASQYNNMRKDIIKNAGDYETAGGTGNVITLAIDAQYVAYAAGDVIKFEASAANTGPATINVNSLGAKAIKKLNDEALIADDIETGQQVILMYDGTNFQMVSPAKAPLMKSVAGECNRAAATASGNLVIAHGLGKTPIQIIFFAVTSDNDSWSNGFSGFGLVDSATYLDGNGATLNVTLSECIKIINGANYQKAQVSASDTTNFTLTWTKGGAGKDVLGIFIATA